MIEKTLTKVIYLKTPHLKIHRGRDDIIERRVSQDMGGGRLAKNNHCEVLEFWTAMWKAQIVESVKGCGRICF